MTAAPELLSHLSSDMEDGEDQVQQVRISDQGSRQQYADVLIEGVPAWGVIDSGPDTGSPGAPTVADHHSV